MNGRTILRAINAIFTALLLGGSDMGMSKVAAQAFILPWQTANGTPLTSNITYLQPLTIGTNGHAIATGDKLKYTNDATGTVTFSNLALGTYVATVSGPYNVTPVQFTVTNTAGTYYVVNLSTVATNAGPAFAWSASVSDARYQFANSNLTSWSLYQTNGFQSASQNLSNLSVFTTNQLAYISQLQAASNAALANLQTQSNWASAAFLTPTGNGGGLTGFTSNQIPGLAASNINSGTIATARLGSGTANSTTFLRGDQTYATVTSGAAASNILGGTGIIVTPSGGNATAAIDPTVVPQLGATNTFTSGVSLANTLNTISGNGGGLTNLTAANLTGFGPHTYYVDVNGNDTTGQRGNSALPFKTLYAWTGSGNPTGVLMQATNGDTIVINAGIYYVPAFPVLSSGVSIVGVGSPTIYQTNSGAGLPDGANSGPFVQPATGMYLSGINFVTTNSSTFAGYCFGLVDNVSALTLAGYTNGFVATNYVVQNCTLTGQGYGVFFQSGNTFAGITNDGTFINCTINSQWQGVYLANGDTSNPCYDVCRFIGCRFNVIANTNGAIGAAFLGVAQGLHISMNNSGAEVSSVCSIYDTGGTITLFGTNTTVIPKLTFVEKEKTLGNFYLNGTQFIISTNQAVPLLGNVFNGQISYSGNYDLQGWFVDTNGNANSVNTNISPATVTSNLVVTGSANITGLITGNGGGLTNLMANSSTNEVHIGATNEIGNWAGAGMINMSILTNLCFVGFTNGPPGWPLVFGLTPYGATNYVISVPTNIACFQNIYTMTNGTNAQFTLQSNTYCTMIFRYATNPATVPLGSMSVDIRVQGYEPTATGRNLFLNLLCLGNGGGASGSDTRYPTQDGALAIAAASVQRGYLITNDGQEDLLFYGGFDQRPGGSTGSVMLELSYNTANGTYDYMPALVTPSVTASNGYYTNALTVNGGIIDNGPTTNTLAAFVNHTLTNIPAGTDGNFLIFKAATAGGATGTNIFSGNNTWAGVNTFSAAVNLGANIGKVNNISTAGAFGVETIAQATNFGNGGITASGTIYTPASSGFFELDGYLEVTTADSTGTIDVSFGYRDDNGDQSQDLSGTQSLAVTGSYPCSGQATGVNKFWAVAGQPITYTVTIVGGTASSNNKIILTLKQLGQ